MTTSRGIREPGTPQIEWWVDPSRCNSCGDCVAICPTKVFTIWPPPCQTACPIGTDVLTYVSLVQQGRFDQALASIRELHPFAGVLGRVCTHPCERECTRRDVDEPVAVCALKRCAAEYGQDGDKWPPGPIRKSGEPVAIAGSGPAGLIAAYDLARRGYPVTVFESLPVAGGMLSVGIPRYRLPREIIKAEIGLIEHLGVEIRLNTAVGKDITLDALREQGYEAILLATGAHRGLELPLAGADLDGVLIGTSFLKEVSLGQGIELSGRVVVLGGGSVAFDCARTALRLGAGDVRIACLEPRDGMPASPEEIKQGEAEGIVIHAAQTPTGLVSADGHITGVECLAVRSFTLDNRGKVHIDPVAGSEHILPADTIILAIGQKPDLSFLPEPDRPNVSTAGLIVVDTDTLATSKPGVFAAGDNVSGPGTVVDALAAGKKAAVAIAQYLSGEGLKPTVPEKATARSREEGWLWWEAMAQDQRHKVPELPVKKRRHSFSEVALGLTPAAAIAEARRCLKCAIFTGMDLARCCQESCRICERHCWQGAIRAY